MQTRISVEDISNVLIQAIKEKSLIDPTDTALIFYDLSYLKDRIINLKAIFPENTLHAIAIKANPLFNILKYIQKLGVGFEAATLPELYLAEKSGVLIDKIVFDSPTKTINEIEYALELGCHINVDSLPELDRIAELIGKSRNNNNSTIGLRINPQIGSGKIAATSVAGEYSKFGIPLKEYYQDIIDCYNKYDWLTGVHVHIGSQGCPVEMLLDGIDVVLNFTTEINQHFQKLNSWRKIDIFDIGGGLPVSYYQNLEDKFMDNYVKGMRDQFKDLFNGKYKLITEFGRHIHANTGWVASRVEYVKRDSKINTAMIHVGADMFLRKCYRPEDWHHEIFVVDSNGRIKEGKDSNKYMIAGPLCFAGDIIAKEIQLPKVEQGDYIIIQDTGAYTLSMWSRYNSRQIPKVIGYTDNCNKFEILKKRENLDSVKSFWS